MLRTFRIGGIHPPENKLSAGKKITALAAPKQVIIPLSQHIGAPAQAVVKKGDLVKVGTLVAKAGGFVSANIHSSVSGKVNKIDNALDSSGYKRPAIYIDVEGDEWEETIDRSDALVKDCTLSSKEIVDKIAAAGIVGLGGATFPTQAADAHRQRRALFAGHGAAAGGRAQRVRRPRNPLLSGGRHPCADALRRVGTGREPRGFGARLPRFTRNEGRRRVARRYSRRRTAVAGQCTPNRYLIHDPFRRHHRQRQPRRYSLWYRI